MGGLLGQLNIPYQADPTAVAEQIAKLRGRSQAQGLFGQLNVPYAPPESDVMRAMKDLAAKRFSTSRELVPAPGTSIVPYGAEASGGIVPAAAPMARTLTGVGGTGAQSAAGAARYGLPELPAALAGGGGGGGFIPPGGAAGAAGAAGEAAGGGGIVPEIMALGAGAGATGGAAASGLARFLPGLFAGEGGALSLMSAAKGAAPYAIGGMVADPLIRGLIPGHSQTEKVLGRTAKYAGLGAAIGSVFPGAGTAVGALAGGTFGAVSSLWQKDKAPKSQQQRNKLMAQLESSTLDDQTKQSIAAQYKTLYSLADTEEEKQAAFDSAKEQLIAAIPEAAKLKADSDTMLASQAMLQQFLRPSVQGMVSSAEAQSRLLNQYAGSLPANMQGPARVGAGQRVADANRTAAAYANQMASVPQIAAMQLAGQRDTQAANLMASQALHGQGGAGGGTDLQALLAGG